MLTVFLDCRLWPWLLALSCDGGTPLLNLYQALGEAVAVLKKGP